MSRCASVQERLVDEGVALIDGDAAIRAHVAGCSQCTAFVEALKQVDTDLSRLPEISAPQSLLARTAKAAAGESNPVTRRSAADAGAKKLAASLAAMVVLVAGFGLTDSVQQKLDRVQGLYAQQFSDGFEAPIFSTHEQSGPTSVALLAPAPAQTRRESSMAKSAVDESERLYREDLETVIGSVSRRLNAPQTNEEMLPSLSPPPSRSTAGTGSQARTPKEQKKRDRQLAGESRQALGAGIALGDVAAAAPPATLSVESEADYRVQPPGDVFPFNQFAAMPRHDDSADADAAVAEALPELLAANKQNEGNRGALREMPGKAGRLAGAKDKREASAYSAVGGLVAPASHPVEVARRFLAEQEKLTGLDFHSASGYWANTYVPGDAAIRLLEARLQRWNRSAIRASIGDSSLEASAQQNWQPFDLPQNAALAAYLHADKRAVHGPSRLRVQVGLQGSQKRSGLRPDMNVGVVLDLRRPLDDATGAKLRALVMALAKARQPGDRFSITVAGHPGGLLVAPETFRHGPIQVAMQSLFAAPNDAPAPAMDLLAALHSASDSVRHGDDASAPLGASLVLLVSTASITEQRESLERMAHENAVAGIGLSVVAVGGGTDLADIDRLVLLGQGHRRVLAAAEDAGKLVDRELHAASRAVARAVRLRIRLAPGVELIDVLGSKNLSEQAAQRVRDAERSIDQRVARNIGIRADRGDDEEGIQIVIPSFFAGDSHAVLLDVLVPGPGPVAEVSVRYKDLVYRRNGVASARLAIDDGQRARGPLEHNVLKNQLAFALARSASTASQKLGAGDRPGALRTLSAARDLIAGMREEIPGWDNDAELRNDEALLAQYLQVLGPHFAGAGQHQQHLADSLRYLAFRRLIPPHK